MRRYVEEVMYSPSHVRVTPKRYGYSATAAYRKASVVPRSVARIFPGS